MKIDVSPYELIARADGRRRAGALLRVTYVDLVQGYADHHPWPELGDDQLERQLHDLAAGRLGPLALGSLRLARADGEARAAGRSLFEGLTVPPSHLSLPFGFSESDLAMARSQGYDRIKLKSWSFSPDELALFRESGLLFRLDLNAKPSFGEVERLLDEWGELRWIDWLEDPCPYDVLQWEALRTRVRVAIDFEEGENAFDVRVIKPARDRAPYPPSRLAFTSYLDHPIGQLGAAWSAARAVADGLPVETGGLVTHEVYEPTEFSRQLSVQNARLVPTGGPGLGFAGELEKLEWRRIRG